MINDPAAVKFSNERIRPLADLVAGAFQQIQSFKEAWEAKGIGNLVADSSEVIDDGSAVDGRTPITGHDLYLLKALADDLVAMGVGENTKIPTVLKISVNPRVL